MSEPEKAEPPIGGYSRRAREVGVVAVLTVLGLLLFFHRLGSLPLFDVDEPTYAEAAREMLLSGDWITPHVNYQPLFDKPDPVLLADGSGL